MKVSESIKELLERADIIYVSTSGKDGMPHLAIGEKMAVPDSDHVILDAWFCVKTVENLTENPAIAIAVVNLATKDGFQVIGKVEKIEERMMMDGFAPELEEKWTGLSTGYKISVAISHVMKFTTGAHSDLPLSSDLGD